MIIFDGFSGVFVGLLIASGVQTYDLLRWTASPIPWSNQGVGWWRLVEGVVKDGGWYSRHITMRQYLHGGFKGCCGFFTPKNEEMIQFDVRIIFRFLDGWEKQII